MTDEQTPAGDAPQEPMQPLSGSTPPPADAPPPPPVNPYETPAAPPPPAVAPPYGTPPPAQPAYGTPPPAQPGYGAPQYPQYDQSPAQPSKAMAITSLVLSILCCFPIGLILAIVVLVRSRDGQNHGKGLAIAAVVISIITLIGGVIGGYALSQVDWDKVVQDASPIENLRTGDCFDSDDLLAGKTSISDITETSCSKAHDAEVLVAQDLTQDQAANWRTTNPCEQVVTDAGAMDKVTNDLTVYALSYGKDPNAGDNLACVAFRTDQTKLDGPL